MLNGAAPRNLTTRLDTTDHYAIMIEPDTPPESPNSCSSDDDLEHTPAPTTPPDSPTSGVLSHDNKEAIDSINVASRKHQLVCVPSSPQAGNSIGGESRKQEGKRSLPVRPIMNRSGKGIDVRATVMALKASNASLRDVLTGLATRADGLEHRFHAQSETIGGDFKKRRIEMWRLKSSCDTVGNDLAQLQAQTALRKADCAKIGEDLDILERNTCRLQNDNKIFCKQINALELSTAWLKTEFAARRREMDTLWAENAEIQRDSQALRAGFEELMAESVGNKRHLDNMIDAYTDLRIFARDHYVNCKTNPEMQNRSAGPQFSLKRKRAAAHPDDSLTESTNKRQKTLLVT
jgi:hypothetical protein